MVNHPDGNVLSRSVHALATSDLVADQLRIVCADDTGPTDRPSVNDRCASFATEDRNETYSGGNVATIIIGGLLLVLGIAGTFIEE